MPYVVLGLLALATVSSSGALIANSVEDTAGSFERSQPNLIAWAAIALAALVVWRMK